MCCTPQPPHPAARGDRQRPHSTDVCVPGRCDLRPGILRTRAGTDATSSHRATCRGPGSAACVGRLRRRRCVAEARGIDAGRAHPVGRCPGRDRRTGSVPVPGDAVPSAIGSIVAPVMANGRPPAPPCHLRRPLFRSRRLRWDRRGVVVLQGLPGLGLGDHRRVGSRRHRRRTRHGSRVPTARRTTRHRASRRHQHGHRRTETFTIPALPQRDFGSRQPPKGRSDTFKQAQ